MGKVNIVKYFENFKDGVNFKDLVIIFCIVIENGY